MERIIYWVVSKKSEGRSPFCEVTPKIVRCAVAYWWPAFSRFFYGSIVKHEVPLFCIFFYLLAAFFSWFIFRKTANCFSFLLLRASNIRKLMFFYWEGEAQIKGRHALSPRGHLLSQLCFLLTENVIFFLKKKVYLNLKEANFFGLFS